MPAELEQPTCPLCGKAIITTEGEYQFVREGIPFHLSCYDDHERRNPRFSRRIPEKSFAWLRSRDWKELPPWRKRLNGFFWYLAWATVAALYPGEVDRAVRETLDYEAYKEESLLDDALDETGD